MSIIDITTLITALSADAPCGEDLEYDAQFAEMEKAATATPERQFGTTLVPAEPADWREVKRTALALSERTRDLRVAAYLTRALLNTDGLSGFVDGLSVLEGLIEQHWEQVYPQLDPDDDNDPTLRINTLVGLCDPETTLQELRCAPLVSSRALGRFGLRDIQIAAGLLAPSTSDDASEHPNQDMINGAFQDVALEALQDTIAAATTAFAKVTNIEDLVTAQLGATQAPSLSALTGVLKEIRQALNEQLRRRGADFAEEGGSDADADADADADGNTPSATTSPGSVQRVVVAGEIASREDVIRTLGKICDYYAKHEPSSPLPFLLKRAKKLASMDFMEILYELAPNGTEQADVIFGIKPPEEEE